MGASSPPTACHPARVVAFGRARRWRHMRVALSTRHPPYTPVAYLRGPVSSLTRA